MVRCNVLGLTVTTLDPRVLGRIFPPVVWILRILVPDWDPVEVKGISLIMPNKIISVSGKGSDNIR